MNKYMLAVCILLFACDSPDTTWFPLREGYWWQYAAVRTIRGELHVQKLIQANLPAVTIDGATFFPRKRADGQIEYYERTPEGVFLVDLEDGSRDQQLREPVEVGQTWQRTSKILFLKVTGAFEATYNRRIKEDIIMDYEIESLDEVLEVAAGHFKNCIRVKGSGSIYGGGGTLEEFLDIDSINIETVEWYAPGVGLIKRTRKEFTHPLEFENIYTEELETIRSG